MTAEGRTTTGTFILLWILFMVAGQSKFLQDPGTFWHIRVGQDILRDGFFSVDHYSFTFSGHEWIPHQWLGEIIMAVLYNFGGFDLLLIVTATILAALFTAMARRWSAIGWHPLLIALVIGLAIACAAGHFHIRPHLGTMVGFYLLMTLIVDVEAKKKSLWQLWWLVPLCWVWSNIHGGVLGGIGTLVLVVAGWTMQAMMRTGPLGSVRAIVNIWAIVLLCCVVTALNPYGTKLPASWLQIYQMSSLPSIIQEHRPLTLNTAGWQAIVGFGLLCLFMLLGLSWREWRVSYLMLPIWLLLTITRVRHAPLFTIITMITLSEAFPFTRWANALQRRTSDWYHVSNRISFSSRDWLYPICGTLIVCGLCCVTTKPTTESRWAKFDTTLWPITAGNAFYAEHTADLPPARIFCEYHYGGYFIFHGRTQVFIDDRCELYGDDFLVHFVRTGEDILADQLSDAGKPLDDWQAKYGGFDYAIVAARGGYDIAFQARKGEFRELHRDQTAVVYQRHQSVK